MRKLLTIILLVQCMVFAAMTIAHIVYPYDLTYNEGYNLARARGFIAGTPYPEATEHPFIPNLYPPLYFLISSFFLGFWVSLFPMRLISILSCAAIFIMMLWIVKKLKGDTLVSLVFLTNPLAMMYFVAIPDYLAIMLSLAGIYMFYRKKHLLVSSAFFVLAFLTKQNAITGFLVVMLFLLLHRRFKELFILGSSFASISAAALLLTEHISGGNFLDAAIFNLAGQEKSLVQYFFLLAFMSIFFYPFLVAMKKSIQDPKALFSLYFFSSFALVLFFLLKRGSDMNYFFEPMIAMIIQYCRSENRRNFLRYSLFLLIVSAFLLTQINHPLLVPISEVRETDIRLAELVREREGDIALTGKAALVQLNGGTPIYEEFEMGERYESGTWDGEMDCGRISLVAYKDKAGAFRGLLSPLNSFYDKIKEFHMIPPLERCISGFDRQQIGDYAVYISP